MMQKHRIYTNIGRDQKINVEINQEWDLLEILSLKFTQKDIFASGNCSEYGVVVGRISANNGYGIPNARVSIFVPEDDLDEDDPVIHSLYPYHSIGDKNEDNYRYNLLPSRQQHPGHNPTGTFFDQKDILNREEVLEVYEKYYSYTVKTNSSGDFMIWGVPIGSQSIHVDIDLSDIGCFSFRPTDFLNKGYGIEQFESFFRFKSSSDIDSLPQIVSFDKTIEVYPFWGNTEICEIGITRTDFDLSERDIKIEPKALILFSSATDESSHAVKRSGKIRKNSGYKCNLQTSEGKIECVRFTGKSVIGSDGVTEYPELEYFNPTETINEDGVAMVQFPMNIDYVYTNELGEQEITNDEKKGIPTGSVARFRFSLDFQSNKVTTAKYLVPNIREFNPNSNGSYGGVGTAYGIEYNEGMLATYQFSDVFEDYIRITPPVDEVEFSSLRYDDDVKEHKKNLILSGSTAPQDYFYRFIYGKVYAVSSFQGTHYESKKRDAFLGIKEIRPNIESDCASSTNYVPTNFAFKNRVKFNIIISQVLLFLQYLFSIITIRFAEIIGSLAFEVGRDLYNTRILRRIGEKVIDFSYRVQDKYTQQLPLTIYPDCEECIEDDDILSAQGISIENYCRCGEIALRIDPLERLGFRLGVLRLFITSYEASIGRVQMASAPGSTLLDHLFPGEWAVETADDCEGNTPIGLALPIFATLHTETLDDGKPRYIVAGYYSGSTDEMIFSSFTDYLQPPSGDSHRSLYFTYLDNAYDGDSGLRMEITYDYWYDLTGMALYGEDYHLLVPEGREVEQFQTIVFRIYDRATGPEIDPVDTSLDIETGCYKYDKLYDESYNLAYLWCTESRIDYDPSVPINPPNGYIIDDPDYMESETMPPTHPFLTSTIVGSSSTMRMPVQWEFRRIGTKEYDRKTKSGLTEFRDGLFTIIPVLRGRSYNLKILREWYRRKRVGVTFCGGVVNYSFIDNWLTGFLYFFKFDKRIRWDNQDEYDLNQRGSRYPRELIFYNIIDKNFYYRSTPYQYINEEGRFIGQSNSDGTQREILHPTTFYDLGPRDEFISEICVDLRIDPSCSVVRDITNTSYQDPANVVEYAINYRLDTTNLKFDVDNFFSKRHYGSNIKVFDGDITQLMSINCEAGIEAFDLDSPHYFMYNGESMDPEDINFDNFFAIGTLYGPTPIDLKLDNNGAYMRLCLNYRLGDYSQVVPFYLWDKKGIGFGPYGLDSDDQTWDKVNVASMRLQGMYSIGGVSETETNYLMADGEEEYILKPMTINHNTFSLTGNTVDMLERFERIETYPPIPPYINADDVIDNIEGDLWLWVVTYGEDGYRKDPWTGVIYVVVNQTWVEQSEWYSSSTIPDILPADVRETFIPQTALNYSGNIQVLSTPFLFYFGLKPGRTSLDLLIKYYGPKDIFTPEEEDECAVDDTSTVVPVVTPTIIVTTQMPTGPTPTPITPTPTPTPAHYYLLHRCTDGSNILYTEYPELPDDCTYQYSEGEYNYLMNGIAVWGDGHECDIDFLYNIIGVTDNESQYIDAGYTYVDITIPLDESGEPYRGCTDPCSGEYISPPAPPPGATTIFLVRNDGDLDGSTTCNKHYIEENEYINIIYIELWGEEVVPFRNYYVYSDSSYMYYFQGGNYRWGIQFGSDPVVHYTVRVNDNGYMDEWRDCESIVPASTPSVTPSPPPPINYYRLLRCTDNSSAFYGDYGTGNDNILMNGTAVWGPFMCNNDFAYVIYGHTQNESEYINAGYTRVAISSLSDFGACINCDGELIAPPTEPPPYTPVFLVRGDETDPDPAASTCNKHYIECGGRIEYAYIEGVSSITPYTQGYTVYTSTTWMYYFQGGNLRWGIQFGSDPYVYYTVRINDVGQIDEWQQCT